MVQTVTYEIKALTDGVGYVESKLNLEMEVLQSFARMPASYHHQDVISLATVGNSIQKGVLYGARPKMSIDDTPTTVHFDPVRGSHCPNEQHPVVKSEGI